MTRRLPSLNQLRAFEAAARHLSFKAGAEELCVTQAAVSHQIKALEQMLGVSLFVRSKGGVQLTKQAKDLARDVSQALDIIAESTAKIEQGRMTGDLQISVGPFIGNRWLMPLLPRFHEAFDGLKINLSLSFENVDLARGNLDAAVRYGSGDWPGLSSILIYYDEVGPVCAPKYLEGRTLPLDPAEIAKLPLSTGGRAADHGWKEWFEAAGLPNATYSTVLEFKNSALEFDSALSGNAAVLGDTRMTAADEVAGMLVRLHPLTITRKQGFYVVFTTTNMPDPRVLAFAGWLQAEAAKA